MEIVIGNIPKHATEDDIRGALGSFADIEKVTLVTQGKEPLAIIELKLTRVEAQALASLINERIHEGHRLSAWVPLFED